MYNLLKRLLVGLADVLTRASLTNKKGSAHKWCREEESRSEFLSGILTATEAF